MTKQNKILILQEYKELNELKNQAEKRIKELKAQIKSDIDAGKYGDYVLLFEEREIKEYVVPSRIDVLVRVNKI